MILSRGLKEVGNDHAGVWGRMFGAEGIAVKGPAGTWHLQGPIRRWMDSEWSKWGSWVQEEERLRGGYMGTRIRSDTEWDGTPFGGDLDRGGTWTNIFSKHHFASSEKWLWGKGTSRQIGDEATPGKRWWFCQKWTQGSGKTGLSVSTDSPHSHSLQWSRELLQLPMWSRRISPPTWFLPCIIYKMMPDSNICPTTLTRYFWELNAVTA